MRLSRLLLVLLTVGILQPQEVVIGRRRSSGTPPLGAISYVNSADLGDNGGSGTLTTSYSVATSTDTALVVSVIGDLTNDYVSGASYNSVAGTLIAKITPHSGYNRWLYMYLILLGNTTSGAHNVVITQSSSAYIGAQVTEYKGMAQSGQPDTFTSGNGASLGGITLTVTSSTDNCWFVGAFNLYDAGTAATAGSGTTMRQNATGGSSLASADSNAPIHPAGSSSLTVNWAGAPDLPTGILAAFKHD